MAAASPTRRFAFLTLLTIGGSTLLFGLALPKVRLDPARFEEALLCLVGNALDAMPSGGVLTVATTPNDSTTEQPQLPQLIIRDTGPGMPIEVLGGRLLLESTGEGTRATITLPWEEA